MPSVLKRSCACSFLCRQRLGYRADKQAEYLTPVPSESVVYGSGETAVVLSKVLGQRLSNRLLLHLVHTINSWRSCLPQQAWTTGCCTVPVYVCLVCLSGLSTISSLQLLHDVLHHNRAEVFVQQVLPPALADSTVCVCTAQKCVEGLATVRHVLVTSTLAMITWVAASVMTSCNNNIIAREQLAISWKSQSGQCGHSC